MTRQSRALMFAAASLIVLSACSEAFNDKDAEKTGDADSAATSPPPPPPPPEAEAMEEMSVTGALNGGMAADGMARAAPRMGIAPTIVAQPGPMPGDIDRDRFPDVEANPVKLVTEEPVSTFSIDADTASYAVARRYLNDGVAPPSDAVRVEELINYFDYAYPLPDKRAAPFSITTTLTPTPWNEDTKLLHIGLKGYDIELDQRPDANLVFLMDVSGSMQDENKLPLAKKAMRLIVDQMGPTDHISLVVYAGAAGVVLEPTPGSEKSKILAALDKLEAGGSTAGGEGLRLAYAQAEANFDADAVNRVLLVTDGDFNVGVVEDDTLEDFVARKRESGVYLTVLGFGEGNYNDRLMQTLAQAGDGTAAYIDTLQEARKVLHDEMAGALFPIADDVKIQVEFNPARVAEYRLIGYETRMLKREDFSNDKVDAGEIGSGHEVTAIYEIAEPGSKGRLIEESRYAAAPEVTGDKDGEYAFLRLRYKLPGEDDSKLIERPITDADAVASIADAPQEARFAVAVAGYGQLLKRQPYLKNFGYDDVIELAQGAKGADEFGYRAEFIQLNRLAATAQGLPELENDGSTGPY